MDFLDSQTGIALMVAGVLVLLGIAAWIAYRHKRSALPEQRFGPPYRVPADEAARRAGAQPGAATRETLLPGAVRRSERDEARVRHG
jgi:LPXTG-motif cell wall-anchored protein